MRSRWEEYSCNVVLPAELEVEYSTMAFKCVASGFASLKDVVESLFATGDTAAILDLVFQRGGHSEHAYVDGEESDVFVDSECTVLRSLLRWASSLFRIPLPLI